MEQNENNELDNVIEVINADDDLFIKPDYENPDGNVVALKDPKTPIFTNIIILLVGFVFFFFLAQMLFSVGLSIYLKNNNLDNDYYTNILSQKTSFQALFQAIVYFSTIIALIITTLYLKQIKALFKPFAKMRTYIYGIGGGLIVLLLSSSYNYFAGLISPIDIADNVNQTAVVNLIQGFPLLMFVIIPFVGPLTEEFIYRYGLFGTLKKINPIVGYVVTGLIFGLIHFNIPSSGPDFNAKLINEFINLPSYIMSGLLFCYLYDKENFATATVAHITNNLIAFAVTLIPTLF